MFLCVFGFAVYFYLSRALNRDETALLESNLAQVESAVEVQNDTVKLTESDSLLTPGTYFALFDMTGRLIAGNAQMPSPARFSPQFNVVRAVPFRGQRWLFLDRSVLNGGTPIGWIRAGRDLGENEHALRNLRVALIVLIPLSVLLALVGGYLLTRQALLPIDSVVAVAGEIARSEDLTRRVGPAKTNDEVGRLIGTLDVMLEKLQSAFDRERRFTADASHELRTPVAAIMSEAEKASRGEQPASELRSALRRIVGQTHRMGGILAQLLILARGEIGENRLEVELLDIGMIAVGVTDSFRSACRKSGVRITVNGMERTTLTGDQTLLTRMLFNVIDNAVRYNRPGGVVKVTTGRTETNIAIEITDTGCGISEEDRRHVFDRFYRVRHTSFDSGTGLGLSIVKAIVDAHHGAIELTSTLGMGTQVRIALPRSVEQLRL